MNRLITLLILLFSFFSNIHLNAQAYCMQFDENPIANNKLEVDIILSSTGNFKLGSANLQFSYNAGAVQLSNPLVFTDLLNTANYSITANNPSAGLVTITIDYTGVINAGKTVPTTGLKIGKLVFDLINPAIDRDFKIIKKGIKGLFLFKDDNKTLITPSAQCPASPYSSQFYDINIELNADIPMQECVESNTPNSIKLNFGDDETKEILPAGFKFKFYCEDVTSLRLGADGAILVNAPATSTLPNTNNGRLRSLERVIAPLWDEWRRGMGTINCLLKDTIMNGQATRMLIVQWNNNSPVDNVTGNNLNTDPMKATFNVVFFENSSIIKFNYKDIDFEKDIIANPELTRVYQQKQNGYDGSVGIKSICAKGQVADGVNNIMFDGPMGVSLYDLSSQLVYKAITFYPVSEACVVPAEAIDTAVCQNSNPFRMPMESSAINGKWTGTGVTYLDNPNIIGAKFTPSVAGSYTLMWEPDCLNLSYTVNITVTPFPTVNAGADRTICAGDIITLNGSMTGATSAKWSAPTGTFTNINALNSNYTPRITAGTVTLTLTTEVTESGCPSVSDEMNITVNEPVYAGSDYIVNVCSNESTRIFKLYDLIVGEQSGGTWQRETGTGGTFDASAGIFTYTPGTTRSTFSYTLIGTPPCPNQSSMVTINVNDPVNAGENGSVTICNTSTTPINLNSIITGEQSGGIWERLSGTGGTFNQLTGVFIPEAVVTTTSTFRYLLIGRDPCADDESVATINIVLPPNAGTNGAMVVCENTFLPINLNNIITGEEAGGSWTRATGTGGSFDPLLGVYTPAVGATTSTFTYTITNNICPAQSSTATITINPAANAGEDGSKTVCNTSTETINLNNLLTGEQNGGVWTRTLGTGGIFDATAGTFTPSVSTTSSAFRYTVSGIGTCVNDDAIARVNIVQQLSAGTSGSTTICSNSTTPINLFSIISGSEAGGTWTRTSGTGGNFNAALGRFTPAVGATTSTFAYTLASPSPCSNQTATATINIIPAPYAGLDDGTTICNNFTETINLYNLISGEQSGGVWTRESGEGGIFNASAGTFTPSVSTTNSTFVYTVTGSNSCGSDDAVATIRVIPPPNAGTSGSTSICENLTTPINLYSLINGEDAGGVWTRTSGTGGRFNATNGTFTPAIGATTSTFAYTITPNIRACNSAVSTATINISPVPNAGSDGNMTVCNTLNTPINLFDLITGEQSGGVWTRTSGIGGIFNASAGTFTPSLSATNSTFKYTVLGASCPDDEALATINIIQQPFAGSDGGVSICDNSTTVIDLFDLIAGENNGGVWTRISGTGGVFDAVVGTFTPDAGATSSTFQYTITANNACVNDFSTAVITIEPYKEPVFDPITICQGQTPIPVLPAVSKNGITGTWSPSVINNQVSQNYIFTPTNFSVCLPMADLFVTVSPVPPSVFAGADQIFCAANPSTYIMDGNLPPVSMTGKWSIVGEANGAVIVNPNNPTTTVIGVKPNKTVKLSWTITAIGGCSKSDTVEIGIDNLKPSIETFNKNAALGGSNDNLVEADAEVCANIVIKDISDNCATRAELMGRLSIIRDSENPSQEYSPDFPKCAKFTCKDVGKNILTQVWVVDRAGNATFAPTIIAVQDNMGFCNAPTPQASISITTEANLPIKNVKVTATQNGATEPDNFSHTSGVGMADIRNLIAHKTYSLRASKEDEPYFGVSTFDIAVISQHILGIKPITSPYTLLAADVNEDNEIDAKDMVVLRNFILRRITSLPSRAWRFVDSSFVFRNPEQPFSDDVAEIISYNQTNEKVRKAFRAIKKGDVTPESTRLLALNSLQTRQNNNLTIQTNDILLEKGKVYAIPFSAENFDIMAYQFTLKNKEKGISIQSIEKGELPNMGDNNFALFDDALTTSWHGKTDNRTPHIFTLHIKAHESGRLSDIIQLGSFITSAEAQNTEGVTMNVNLVLKNTILTEPKPFALYQNYPNPFDKSTTIAFDLPKAGHTRLTIFNIEGKIVYDKEGNYPAGYNEITVNRTQLNKSGILYYRLTAGENSAVKKMIIPTN